MARVVFSMVGRRSDMVRPSHSGLCKPHSQTLHQTSRCLLPLRPSPAASPPSQHDHLAVCGFSGDGGELDGYRPPGATYMTDDKLVMVTDASLGFGCDFYNDLAKHGCQIVVATCYIDQLHSDGVVV